MDIGDPAFTDTRIRSLLAKKEQEEELRGSSLLSTLVKLNLAYSTRYLQLNDLPRAHKFIRIAFKHLNESFEEALTVTDTRLKSSIFNSIRKQQARLINIYLQIAVSDRNTTDLTKLVEMRVELAKISAKRIYGKSADFDLFMQLLVSLNDYLRSHRIFIADNDTIIDYIDTKLTTYLELPDEQRCDIEWLKVRLYWQLVRQERPNAFGSPEVARKIAKYREKSSALLFELGAFDNYVEDRLDFLCSTVLGTSNKKDWFQAMHVLSAEVEDYYQQKVLNNREASHYYLRCYTRVFEITKTLETKVTYLEQILIYAQDSKSVQYNFFLPLYYLLDLMKELRAQNEISAITSYIDEKHNLPLKESGSFKDNTSQNAKEIYTSAMKLIKAESNFVGTPVFQSLNHLQATGVIPYNSKYIRLIYKALVYEVDRLGIFTSVATASEEFEDEQTNATDVLNEMLSADEGSNIEVKLSMDAGGMIDKIAKTICAFANDNGGHIIIGLVEKKYFNKRFPDKEMRAYKEIADDFLLIGYRNIDAGRQKLASCIRAHTSIGGLSIDSLYTTSLIKVNRKTVAIIQVSSFAQKYKQLILYDGKPHRRYDNQTMEMTFAEANSRVGELYGDTS